MVLQQTSEGRLLYTVMNISDQCSANDTKTLYTAGMSGIGKTNALKGVFYHVDVHSKNPNSVCYMSLGQYAINRTIMNELTRLVHSSGGVKPTMM